MILSKLFSKNLIYLFLIASSILISCDDPEGAETTIRRVEDLYSKGQVESFKYFSDGSWIQVKLKESALRKGGYANLVKSLIEKGQINSYSQFRLKVRVLSAEQFQNELLEIENTSPDLRKVSIIYDNE